MEEQFVPYHLALLLRDKGFREYCIAEYRQWDGGRVYLWTTGQEDSGDYTVEVQAPLWQQVTEWLDMKQLYCSADIRVKNGELLWYPIYSEIDGAYTNVSQLMIPSKDKRQALQTSIEFALKKL